jgi:RNA polymerase sigma factor (sigma-70 family)
VRATVSRSGEPAPHSSPEREGRRGEPGDEQAEILALVEPLRRFALSRVHDAHDADDITQETLTRVLAARGRLEDGTLTGYAFAVARNLVAGRYREADLGRRHSAHLVDRREPPQPEHVLLAAEDRRALATALKELPQRQRDQLVEHVVHDVAVSELGGESGAAAVAAQLARTRARLRLDYLLALRGIELPTPRCRPVLLAVSAGDRRRQGALRAGDHLTRCRTCAELSEPLLQRRRALGGIVPWLPLGAGHGHLMRWVRGHPAQAAGAGASVVVAAVVAVVVAVMGHASQAAGGRATAAPPAPAATSTTSTTPEPTAPARRVTADTVLTGPDGPVLPTAGQVRALAGQQVRARGVPVLAVPADEGFWVGDGPGHRVWVQLRTRGESAQTVRAGQRLTFTGLVVRHDTGFAGRVGVSPAEGAGELVRQGGHVEVDPGGVTIR